MFQGFVWNINSFDQEGVQLGKILAKKALGAISRGESTGDATLDALIDEVMKRAGSRAHE